MKEQEVILKSYRKEIEVLTLQMDVPVYAYDDEKRNYFPKYEDVLLRLFNNKRDNREILEIRNYYGSNKIAMVVNLTAYLEDSYTDDVNCINHLINWFKSGCDVADEDVTAVISKGYIYDIPYYNNRSIDCTAENYIDWED